MLCVLFYVLLLSQPAVGRKLLPIPEAATRLGIGRTKFIRAKYKKVRSRDSPGRGQKAPGAG